MDWTDATESSDGSWINTTEEPGPGGSGQPRGYRVVPHEFVSAGMWGLFEANLGGKWRDAEVESMRRTDLIKCPGQIYIFQGAPVDFLAEENIQEDRERYDFLRVFAEEDVRETLAIMARKSLVQGIRKLCFRRLSDGESNIKNGGVIITAWYYTLRVLWRSR